jgi:hypothetical protein
VQSVTSTGTVGCSASLASTAGLPITGYVQLNDNPSQSSTLFQTSTVKVTATCLANTHAVITVQNLGAVALNYETRTNAGAATGTIGVGASTDVANTATNDLLSLGIVNSSSAQFDSQITMWAQPTTTVDCVFWGSARTG